jgi:hypothetical protein
MRKWTTLAAIAALFFGASITAKAASVQCDGVSYGGYYNGPYLQYYARSYSDGLPVSVGENTPGVYTAAYTGIYGVPIFGTYQGTIQGSARVAALSYLADTYNGQHASESVSIPGRTSTNVGGGYSIWAAAPGDVVTVNTFSNDQVSNADVAVADAPSVSASNVSAYLSPLSAVPNPSNAVLVTFGADSLNAYRPEIAFPSGPVYASPFEDDVQFVGSLLLNGGLVGSFDESLDFGANDGTPNLSLSNDLTNALVSFSGVAGPTASLKLDWAVVDNAYDANGTDDPIILDSGSEDDSVSLPNSPIAVPLPTSLSAGLALFAGLGLYRLGARKVIAT